MGGEDDRFEPDMGDDRFRPLFETSREGRVMEYRVFAATVFVCICWILYYRVSHVPEDAGLARLVWVGMLFSEFWFGLYWFVTQSARWNVVRRFTFKDRLSQRYENDLPGVDVFVCTADPEIEPPLMVANTILSAVALDYPAEKLAVYLSDDGGSELTFYALLEASEFAKHWVPFCKRFNIEPRSPAAYFSSKLNDGGSADDSEAVKVGELYEEMVSRIETAMKLRRVPEEVRLKNKKGFAQWDAEATRRNHRTVLQILLDGRRRRGRRDGNREDVEGNDLPTLVYLAREKRPHQHHNFKAGAVNALIRVSSKITCGMIILILDCDMYSNNSQSVRDALCFFLCKRYGQDIAFVQFPQHFENITTNDLYGCRLRVVSELELHGLDGNGGPMYIGTGCFHRRDVICGRRYGESDWTQRNAEKIGEISEAEIKALASCTYDENSRWGKEMGLKYGCPVEDVITGLVIQCRGWKSAYFNPERKAFVGVAPATLLQTLVQHKRWSEGDFQVVLSQYSPLWYAHGKISLGLRLGYCCYCLWAPCSIPTLFYSIFPSLSLLGGIPLFPKSSSAWFVPFAYVTIATNVYSLAEFLWFGGTIWGWWNEQRMWLYKRTTSYLFGFIDAILKLLGFSETAFVVTTKVADEEEAERFKKDKMEFGADSPMFFILATLALINLLCFFRALQKLTDEFQTMSLQFLLNSVLVIINWPLYEGLFLRRDKGRMPLSVTVKSVVLALSVCTCFAFL